MIESRRFAYFGPPWPSGICCEDDGAHRVDDPIGEKCLYCRIEICPGDQGSFVVVRNPDFSPHGNTVHRAPGSSDSRKPPASFSAPVHRECSLRAVLGGIGHHEDHDRWCVQEHDPDGGRTYRQSALEVWRLCANGLRWE